MHEKWSKIDFFANFQKLQKKLPICKKKYAEIRDTVRSVVKELLQGRDISYFTTNCNQKGVGSVLRHNF